MLPKFKKIQRFGISYNNDEELKNIVSEIFKKEIYKVELEEENPLIFDIGAHIGLSIIYFKSKYPNSKILGFEPNPNNYIFLEENIMANNIENTEIKNIALGRKVCKRELYIDSTGDCHFSTSSFTKDSWSGKQKTRPIQVKVEKLSKYISSIVDLLKIDIEGEEFSVLKELEEANKLEMIRNIIMEYHPIKKNGLKKITTILNRNNFDISFRDENGKDIMQPRDGLILILGKNRD